MKKENTITFDKHILRLCEDLGTEYHLASLALANTRFANALPILALGNSPGSFENEIEIKYADQTIGLFKFNLRYGVNLESSRLSTLSDKAQELGPLIVAENRKRAASVDLFVAELHGSNKKFNWTGVYLIDPIDSRLKIEAYRGAPTPHGIIPLNSGICGAAVREEKTLNIPDVNADPRYLSCSIETKSEIVVPVFKNGVVVGEIDIDSHELNAFGEKEETDLKFAAEKLAELL
jgi:GAF domain-containing protein